MHHARDFGREAISNVKKLNLLSCVQIVSSVSSEERQWELEYGWLREIDTQRTKEKSRLDHPAMHATQPAVTQRCGQWIDQQCRALLSLCSRLERGDTRVSLHVTFAFPRENNAAAFFLIPPTIFLFFIILYEDAHRSRWTSLQRQIWSCKVSNCSPSISANISTSVEITSWA